MRRVATLASLVLSCGDNRDVGESSLPLAQAAELVIVAHPDDDILLMQPDVLEALHGDDGVTAVYVTAGNGASGGLEAALRRYEGIKSAYSWAAGGTTVGAWRCGTLEVHGHPVEHCRLRTRNVSLVFLGYPDGGKQGELESSLLHLWQGAIDHATSIAPQPTHFTRDSLISTVADIVRQVAPLRVRTLEIAGSPGRDHADQGTAGPLTVLALAAANTSPQLLAYRGYAIGDEPPNKLPPIFDASLGMLARYEACAMGCGTCGEVCTSVDDQHATWLERRYAVGFRRGSGGQLRSGTQCLDEALQLVSCNVAPIWKVDSAGELRTRDLCLTADETGALAMERCTGGATRRFALDDEGHIFAGVAPIAATDAIDGALWCLTPTQDGATLERCATPAAPTWELVPRTAETQISLLGISNTGRDVRLGDIDGDHRADICAFSETGQGLQCGHGLGNGTFSPATRIDAAGQPLSIEAKSLTLGDVDGDGRLDACGLDATGIECATFASGFAVARFSPAFSLETQLPTTAASLPALDADGDGRDEICGVDTTGATCAQPGPTLETVSRSTWPAPDAVVWFADLDGDHGADWCTATDTGPACAVYAQSELTTDGSPWGYSHAGMVDVAPANTATVAFGDIDGDGRADYCVPRQDRIVCARSQGRAFGPRSTTLAVLPNQSAASALWLGDLDGDGRMDPCVNTGATIACAVQP